MNLLELNANFLIALSLTVIAVSVVYAVFKDFGKNKRKNARA